MSALCDLAKRKGYGFVCSNSSGVNAFFVRSDLNHDLPRLTANEGCIMSRQRESRDAHGNLTFLSGVNRIRSIQDMEIIDLKTEKMILIGNILVKEKA